MNARKLLIGLLAVLISSISFSSLHAQDEGFIYGKVTTIDGTDYQGQIRWEKEEIYWTDLFNSTKRFNDNIDYLSREDMEYVYNDRHNRNRSRWGDWNWSWGDRDHTHQFITQFGNIKTIHITGRERVEVELKNGKRFELEGGSNDIGNEIRIYDRDLGKVEVRWSRIERVEFSATPAKLDDKYGDPLYGTVDTHYGEYTGFIQWDHDERITTDVLDGDTRDGDLEIEFGKIKSIEKEGGGSNVVMKSGRQMYLRGSNDVNSENRGIIVSSDKFGRVDIPWREFKKVTFEDKAPNSGLSYNNFEAPKELNGTVKTTRGETLSGRLIFDVDEEFNVEIFDGNDDELEYRIPFSIISKVSPKNYNYSNVELKSGIKLLLGETQDTDERNDGVLVFKSGAKDPTYVPWEQIDEIAFN